MARLDQKDWPLLSHMNKELKTLLDSRPKAAPAPPLSSFNGDLTNLRKAIDDTLPPLSSTTAAAIVIHDIEVKARDGYQIPVRVYQPAKPSRTKAGRPLVVFIHGGGFCFGGIGYEDKYAGSIAETLDAVAVAIHYRLAPEHAFPAAPNDCWDVLQWCMEEASDTTSSTEFSRKTSVLEGIDPSKGFVVGGQSAGANIAVALALRAAKELLAKPITGLALLAPLLTDSSAIPDRYRNGIHSYEQNGGYEKSFETIKYMLSLYKGDLESPLYNVLVHSSEFGILPPTYLQICGLDVLRDEGLVLEQELRQRFAIKTRLDVYAGLPHSFWTDHPTLSSSKKAHEDLLRGIEWLLKDD